MKALGRTPTTNHSWKHQKLSVANLKHGIGISDFRLALELACDVKKVTLVFWKRDKSPELNAFMDPGGTKTKPGTLRRQFRHHFPAPDGAFIIEYSGRRSLFLVEIDTGSMSGDRMVEKFQLLDQYERRRRAFLQYHWRSLDPATQRDQAQGPTGKEIILGLRILTITKDARRRDKLIEWLIRAPLRSRRFYVAASSDLIDFEHPAHFWNRVWLTPHPDGEAWSIAPSSNL